MFHKPCPYPTHWLRKILIISAAETPHCWKHHGKVLNYSVEPHDLIIQAFRAPRLIDTEPAFRIPLTVVGPMNSAFFMASPVGGGSHIWKFNRLDADRDWALEMLAEGCRLFVDTACDSRCAQVPAPEACNTHRTAERFVCSSTAMAVCRTVRIQSVSC